LPLENAAISHDGNLALLLSSIGPVDGTRVVWDESLHEDVRGLWSYAEGTPVHLLWAQLALLGFLLILSYSGGAALCFPTPSLRGTRRWSLYTRWELFTIRPVQPIPRCGLPMTLRLLLGRQTGPQAGSD